MTDSVASAVISCDIHGRRGAFMHVRQQLAEVQPSIWLDAGDLIDEATSGPAIPDSFSAMVGLAGVGNHGFREHFESLGDRNLATNISAPSPAAGHPSRSARFRLMGRQCTAISILAEDAFLAVPRSERHGFSIVDPRWVVEQYAGSSRLDDLIVLSHAGLTYDLWLAASLDRFSSRRATWLVSGHCHTATPPVIEVGGVRLLRPLPYGERVIRLSGGGVHASTMPLAIQGVPRRQQSNLRAAVELPAFDACDVVVLNRSMFSDTQRGRSGSPISRFPNVYVMVKVSPRELFEFLDRAPSVVGPLERVDRFDPLDADEERRLSLGTSDYLAIQFFGRWDEQLGEARTNEAE